MLGDIRLWIGPRLEHLLSSWTLTIMSLSINKNLPRQNCTNRARPFQYTDQELVVWTVVLWNIRPRRIFQECTTTMYIPLSSGSWGCGCTVVLWNVRPKEEVRRLRVLEIDPLVYGSRFMVWRLGFAVWGFGVGCSGFGAWCHGFMVWGLGRVVWGSGLTHGLGLKTPRFGV